MRDEALKDVALRAEKPAQLAHGVLQVVDPAQRFLGCLFGDLVFQLVDFLVEVVQHRKRGVDERVDGEIREERGFAMSQLRTLMDPLLQVFQLG